MKTCYDSFVLCKSNHNTHIIPHTVMKSRYTNVKYHCEISWYFSVHCLPQSLRNYKEEAKIKPSEKALAMPGQKDCYIISTCTPSCPATGTAWLWWLAWAGAWLCYPLMWLSIYNKEWDITVIQPISSTSTSELFKKALVDIWIDLFLIKFQFLAILCVFVFLSLEEFFITGVQSCPY